MTALTIVQPYYRNPGMLEILLENFQRYDARTKAQIEWIIVDDHSPEPAIDEIRHADKETKAQIKLLVVDDDIPWNQHGARNLGAREAQNRWLLMADMDRMIVSDHMAQVLDYIKTGKMAPDHHYKPLGLNMKYCTVWGGEKPIVNQFFCTRAAYWDCGGYDEDYCGTYGGDGPFLRALEAGYPLKYMRDITMFRYDRHIVPDATTLDLPRDRGDYARMAKQKQREGRTEPRDPIRFRWHQQPLV